MAETPKAFIYQLEGIVHRCFEEGKKAGWIQLTPYRFDGGVKPVMVLVNEYELAKHISKTVIGELYELEMIRKIAPIIRAVRTLGNDFAEMDSALTEEWKRQNLRVPPPTGEEQK